MIEKLDDLNIVFAPVTSDSPWSDLDIMALNIWKKETLQVTGGKMILGGLHAVFKMSLKDHLKKNCSHHRFQQLSL